MGYCGLWGCKGISFHVREIQRNLLHNWLKLSFNAIADLCFQCFIEVTAIVLNSNHSECIATFAPPIKTHHNTGDLSVSISLSVSFSPPSLFQAPPSSEKQQKDYCIIQDAGVEDLIWGMLHLLSQFSTLPPAVTLSVKKNSVPTRECQECLIILLWHKKDFGVPGSKCVWLEGMGVTSVSSAEAGIRL